MNRKWDVWIEHFTIKFQVTGMTQGDGMGRQVGGGSGLGTRVHPHQIHVDVWQNQYNIVK